MSASKFRRKGYKVLSVLGLIDAVASGNPKAVARYAAGRYAGRSLRALLRNGR